MNEKVKVKYFQVNSNAGILHLWYDHQPFNSIANQNLVIFFSEKKNRQILSII